MGMHKLTMCKAGLHPLSGDNLGIHAGEGFRFCKACAAIRCAKWHKDNLLGKCTLCRGNVYRTQGDSYITRAAPHEKPRYTHCECENRQLGFRHIELGAKL